ncbi:hypothetical protein SLEP1_g31403 [Rubroshorea leprosula]|uniref:Uncharacterized protein n=1 Tax=Rubroshorea leprosula TaxID=152421 RepID=A0AAV5K9T8_9ROSI|nr:hypothetical protein SLEP1_g31403 [Rubroshorea leprosula]
MAKMGMICFLLAQILLIQAMGGRSDANPPGIAVESSGEDNVVVAAAPVERSKETAVAEAPEMTQIRRLGKHHSTDKSVAGGGIIIAGLVTAIFAAVVCYIRVTRKRGGVY